MNNSHMYGRTVATNHYSSNTQAAKPVSALSNSMKMANKPLFLVAAAMLMLIFLSHTVVAFSSIISPSSATYDTGELISLTASASTSAPTYTTYTYQWYNVSTSTPVAMNGANSSTFSETAAPVTSQQTVKYYVAIDGSDTGTPGGSNVDSAKDSYVINPALVAGAITASNSVIDSGQSTTLTANPSGGTPPYSYQWYTGTPSNCGSGSPISGATSSTYSASPISTTYYCYTVSDSATSPVYKTSATDEVTVNSAPTVTLTPVPPNDLAVTAGQPGAFTATVTGGTGPFDLTLFNMTGNVATSSTNTINSPGGSAELIYTPTNPAGAIINFNATVTDMGTTTHYVFNSTKATMSSDPTPTITIAPSNILLDSGQYEVYTITLTADSQDGPFTVNFYNQTGSQHLIQSITMHSSNPTATVSFKTGSTGTFTYNAVATDQATNYVFTSISNSIKVNPDPTITIAPSNSVLDNGQTETYAISVTNGFGAFNVELYNVTGNKQQGFNVTIPPAGSKTVTFKVGATGQFIYNAIAIDTGTTYPYVFGSSPNTITVNTNLKAPILNLNDPIFDMGQTVILMSDVPTTGTSPYTYNFIVANSITNNILFYSGLGSSNSFQFTSNTASLGGDYAYVVVNDSASTNGINTSAHVLFTVYKTPSVSITPSNSVLDKGQTETYTITVNNGKGPFEVQLYNVTGNKPVGSNITITSPGSSGKVSFVSGATGTFTYKALATDQGPTNHYLFSSTPNPINVNSALTPPSTPTVTNTIIDQGQNTIISAVIPTTGTGQYYYQWLVSHNNGPYSSNNTDFVCYGDPSTHSSSPTPATDPNAPAGQTVYCTFDTNSTVPQGTYSFKLNVTDSASTPVTVLSPASQTVTVNTAPFIDLFPTNVLVDSGQTETFAMNVNGGTSPFVAELYNITESKQVGSNVTITQSSGSGSLSFYYSSTKSLTLPSGASSYIFAAADGDYYVTSPSWTPTVTGTSAEGDCGGPCTSIGTQSSNTGLYTLSSADEGVIAGIGLNTSISDATVFKISTTLNSSDPSNTLTYAVPNAHSTVFIVATSGWYADLVSLPSGCQMIINTSSYDVFANVTMAVCNDQSPGTYSVKMSVLDDNTPEGVAAAAYVFPMPVSLYPANAKMISFKAGATGIFTYNTIATDTGTTKGYMFSSFPTQIDVSTALLPTIINVNNTKFDTGQSVTLASSVPTTGTSGYTYNFIVENSGSKVAVNSKSSNTYAFTANSAMIGTDSANVVVNDSATTPEYVGSSNTVSFTVKQAPTVSLTTSNQILDTGQIETLTATVPSGGFGPFKYTFYNVTANAAITGCSNLSTDTCTFATGATGSFTYNVVVTDTGTSVPYVFNSTKSTIVVNTDPTLTITPYATTIDSGGTETVTLTVTGGTSPFTLLLLNYTQDKTIGSNVIVNVPGGSNTISFKVPSSTPGTLTIQGFGTDLGTTSPYVFNSTKSKIEVSTNPTLSIAPTNSVLISGQYEKYNVFETNGIGPFNIELYNVTGSKPQGTNITLSQNTNGNFVPFKTGATGIFTFNATATDTGTTPSYMFSSAPNTITVFSVPKASITPSAPTIDNGQSILLTAGITGGSGNFTYQWYAGTPGGSNTLLSGDTNPTATVTPKFTSPSTSTFTLKENDSDFLWTSVKQFYAPAAPFGTWSATPSGCYDQPVPGTGICSNTPDGYANLGNSMDLGPITVNGTTLTTSILQSPGTNVAGNKLIFVNNNNGGVWVLMPNILNYVNSGNFSITEYWRGFLKFSGTPTSTSFKNGMLVQWDYVNAPQSASAAVQARYPDAAYDSSAGAWLIGFNIYLLNSTCDPNGCRQPSSYYNIPFPASGSQLTVEPNPASQAITLTLNGNPVSISYGTLTPASTNPYFVVVNDVGTTTHYVFNSIADNVIVEPVLGITGLPTTLSLDSGQQYTFTATTQNGTAPYSLSWNTGSLTVISGCINTASCTVEAPTTASQQTTSVSVTATDSAQGTPAQSATASTAVKINPQLSLTGITPDVGMDSGQEYTFSASASAGTTPYTYLWNTAGLTAVSGTCTTSSATCTVNAPTVSSSTKYSVSLTLEDSSDGSLPAVQTELSTVTVNPVLAASPNPPSLTNQTIDVGQISVANTLITGGTNILGGQYNAKFANLTSGCIPYGCGATFPLVNFNTHNNLIMVITPLGQSSIKFTAIAAGSSQTNIYDLSSVPGIASGKSIYGTWTFSAYAEDSSGANYGGNSGSQIIYTSPVNLKINPALTEAITPSSTTLDQGQSVSFTNDTVGGTKSYSYQWYESYNGGTYSKVSGATSHTYTFSTTTSTTAGTYSFKLQVTDSASTKNIVNSTPATVVVNLAPSISITPSSNSIHADQVAPMFNITTGGTEPYAYQWYIKPPGGSYSPISAANGGTMNDFTFNVIKLGYTTGGVYDFELQGTDSATTPVVFNSVPAAVTVNAMFSKPQTLLNVNANVINDEDSGSNGPWGMDTFTRHIVASQIGLQTFTINFTDNGNTLIPVGAKSPGLSDVIQPYNGITTMRGAQNYTFNATAFRSLNSTFPIHTDGTFIGTLNDQGTIGKIINNTYSSGPSSEMYYIDGYFSNPTGPTGTGSPMSVASPNWGGYVYMYKYSVYPSQSQNWIDAGNVLEANAGEIITYQVPKVQLSAPSNTVLDQGQTETYSATVYNGIGPFTVDLMQTDSSTPIATKTVSAGSIGNAAGTTVTFATFTPKFGTDTYYVKAVDTGTTPGAVGSANYNFISTSNTVVVNATPTIKLNITNATLDSGQTETFNIKINGGTSPFEVELYNITGSKPVGNVLVDSPGGTNTISFKVYSSVNGNTFTYNAIATDMGTTSPYTFASNSNTMTVDTNMSQPKVTVGGKHFDVGEAVEASVSGFGGGTPPYSYSFTIVNKNTSAVLYTCTNINAAICTFTATQTGVYGANVIVSDSASTPATVTGTSNTFDVNPNFFNSEAKVTLNRTTLDIGNSILLNANIVGLGGTTPYAYTFKVYNYSTKALVYTSPTQTTASTSNAFAYAPSTNGIFYAAVTVMDNASPQEPITSPNSSLFLVGPISHPTLGLSATSPALDSGQTETMQINEFGGVGPFTVALYNVTNASKVQQIGSNVTVSSSGGTNTISFIVPSVTSASVFSYNAVATDSVTHDVFNSTKVSITVNPPLNSNVTAIPNAIEVGQSALITATIKGGTGPYNFNFTVLNGNTPVYAYDNSSINATNKSNSEVPTVANAVLQSAGANAIGTDAIHVMVTDSTYHGGICTNNCEVLNNTIIVYATPSVSIAASNTSADIGQMETLTATIPANTGSGNFMYTFYNTGTNNAIIGCSAITTGTCTFAVPGAGPYAYNVVANDVVTGYTFNSTHTTLSVYPTAPVVKLTPSNATPLIGQSVTYTVSITGGSGSFAVQPYNVTSGKAIGTAFTYPGTSTFVITASSTAGTYTFNVIATDSTTNYAVTGSNVLTVGTLAPTTTVNSGGGGGGGGGGGAPGGGGSDKPTVVPYNTTSTHGWKVLNFTQDDSESVMINGHMFDITLNSISPTLVDVTVNGFAYTLNMNQPVSLTGMANYSVDLTSISYLPIQHSAVVEVYGPNLLAKTNSTTTSGKTVNNTKTTVKTTATTTVATTTVPPKTSTVKPTTTVSAPPASTEELGAGIIVVILLIIGGMYYYTKVLNKKKGRR